MAGRSADFHAEEFRAGLRFAMNLAAPPVADEQVVFHFPASMVYVGSTDAEGVPFDPDSTVQMVEPPTVQVPCAVEYVDVESQPSNFGYVAPTKIKIILLDQDHAKVKGTSYVTIAGDKYNYKRTEPPSGIFDAGVYVLHFVAENDT